MSKKTKVDYYKEAKRLYMDTFIDDSINNAAASGILKLMEFSIFLELKTVLNDIKNELKKQNK